MVSGALRGVLSNITLLVALGALYSFLLDKPRLQSVGGRILAGLAAGLIGIALMLNSWPLIPGVIFDARSILLVNIGLFLGPIPAWTSAVCTSLFRVWQGGAGALTGVAVILTSVGTGLLWRRFLPGRRNGSDFLILGFLVHLLMLLCLLLMPSALSLDTLRTVALPVLTLYPLGTFLLGMLLKTQSDRQSAQEEMERTSRRLKGMLENGWDIVYLLDREGLTSYVSAAVTGTLGYSPHELVGHRLLEWIHPEELPEVIEKYRDLSASPGGTERNELRLRHKLGNWIWVETVATNQLSDPAVSAIVINVRPIGERKRAELSLLESENRFRRLFELSGDAILILERGRFIDCNQATLTMLGFDSKEAFLERPHPSDHSPEYQSDGRESKEKAEVMIAQALEKGSLRFEWMHTKRGGEVFPVEVLLTAISREEGNEILHVTWRDISERKQAERALQASEAKHRTIFESAPLGIALADPLSGRLLEVNPRYAQILGRSRKALTHLDWMEATHPEDRQREADHLADLKDGRIFAYQLEKRYLQADGDYVWVRETVTSIRLSSRDDQLLLAMIEDISEQKRVQGEKEELQLQLQQAQRLDSIGRLAGGVAHDSNNMLAVILGNVELALSRSDPAEPLFSELQEIERAAQRSAALIQQLLAFSRQQAASPRPLDLNAVITEMLKMLRRLIGENIELLWEPGQDLWTVKIDPTQIDQILANLSVNARDAIDAVGTVRIQTRNVAVDPAFISTHPSALPGHFVMLSVTDDGCGMSVEVQANIFEPFFTTKPYGEGSGLGLATVFGIVRQNGGFILVSSKPGAGSTFQIFLPRHLASGLAEPLARVEEVAGGGRETILVVEDEAAILDLCRKMLEGLGYHVLTAESPGAALQRVKDFSDPIDLLITDVIMPEMNGKDLAEKLQTAFPGIRRLYMSGYTAEVIGHQGVLADKVHFIQKPFSMKALAAKVREILEVGSGEA